MDNQYISKPHTISAFQFTGDPNFKPPKWFKEAYHRGEIQVTINSKHQYIVVYGEGQTEKAFVGHWVCLSAHDKIYVLDDQSFKEDYDPK